MRAAHILPAWRAQLSSQKWPISLVEREPTLDRNCRLWTFRIQSGHLFRKSWVQDQSGWAGTTGRQTFWGWWCRGRSISWSFYGGSKEHMLGHAEGKLLSLAEGLRDGIVQGKPDGRYDCDDIFNWVGTGKDPVDGEIVVSLRLPTRLSGNPSSKPRIVPSNPSESGCSSVKSSSLSWNFFGFCV